MCESCPPLVNSAWIHLLLWVIRRISILKPRQNPKEPFFFTHICLIRLFLHSGDTSSLRLSTNTCLILLHSSGFKFEKLSALSEDFPREFSLEHRIQAVSEKNALDGPTKKRTHYHLWQTHRGQTFAPDCDSVAIRSPFTAQGGLFVTVLSPASKSCYRWWTLPLCDCTHRARQCDYCCSLGHCCLHYLTSCIITKLLQRNVRALMSPKSSLQAERWRADFLSNTNGDGMESCIHNARCSIIRGLEFMFPYMCDGRSHVAFLKMTQRGFAA